MTPTGTPHTTGGRAHAPAAAVRRGIRLVHGGYSLLRPAATHPPGSAERGGGRRWDRTTRERLPSSRSPVSCRRRGGGCRPAEKIVSCVAVAGLFGALTSSRKILFVQIVPALVVLALVFPAQ
ncbi:DUF1304 family protein [Kitasatospora sp. NPDC058190]|uniref:DUF1304 family protein n=1 Tax=Kitasatospora sp. NPDC058190 TaxID=3346371 RepID=UPI0036DE81FB